VPVHIVLRIPSVVAALHAAVLTGEAQIVADVPRPDEHPEYLGKYRAGIASI